MYSSFQKIDIILSSIRGFFEFNKSDSKTKLTPNISTIFNQLDEHSRSLESVSKNSEKVFLDVATILEKVFTDVQSINLKSAKILDIETNKEVPGNVLSATTDLVRGTIDLVIKSSDLSLEVVERLDKIEKNIDRLLKTEADLKSAIAPFTIIQMLFKVHSAHLEESQREVFFGISDQLFKLDQRVRDIFLNQFSNLKLAKETISKLLREIVVQVNEAKKLINTQQQRIDSTLKMLDTQIEENLNKNFKLNNSTQQLQKEASQLVMAMQYHDITHQRLLHVCQAIHEMKEEYTKFSSSNQKISISEFGFYLKGAVEIQRNQIQSLLEGISEAETKMKEGVTNLLKTSSNVSHETVKMDDISAPGSSVDGVVQSMIEMLDTLPDQLNEVYIISMRMDQMIRPVTDTVSNLTGALTSISMEMRLIALNSQIQAAQIQEGTGLDHLSSQTCSLSDQILTMNESLSLGLEELVQEFGWIVNALNGSVQNCESRRRFVEEESAKNIAGLHQLRDLSLGLLMEIFEVDQGIRSNGENLIKQLCFSGDLSQACEPIYDLMKDLEPIISQARTGSGESDGLNRLKKNYTMQQEHQIHQKTMGESSPVIAATPAVAAAATIDIDFFDETPTSAAARGTDETMTTQEKPAEAIEIDFFDEPAPTTSVPCEKQTSDAFKNNPPEPKPSDLDFFEDFDTPAIDKKTKTDEVILKKELDNNIELF